MQIFVCLQKQKEVNDFVCFRDLNRLFSQPSPPLPNDKNSDDNEKFVQQMIENYRAPTSSSSLSLVQMTTKFFFRCFDTLCFERRKKNRAGGRNHIQIIIIIILILYISNKHDILQRKNNTTVVFFLQNFKIHSTLVEFFFFHFSIFGFHP